MQRVRWSWMVLGALLVPVSAMAGQMYKWTDADGKIHYSDQPPPGQGVKQSRTISTPTAPAPAPAADAEKAADGKQAAVSPARQKTPAEQEMEFRKRRLEAAEAEKKKEQEAAAAKEKQDNCERAKARVAALQNGGRITTSSPAGEQVYLDDAQIAKELIDARKVADSWCKG